jgi:hypothetical protein
VSAVSAAAVAFRTLADGSARVTIDFVPQDVPAAFAMLGKPGQPIAVAALREGFAAVSDKPSVKPGPLCLEAVRFCEMPEFQEWIETTSAEQAKQWLLARCGVSSRKELDMNVNARVEFVKSVRLPFMKYMRERQQ